MCQKVEHLITQAMRWLNPTPLESRRKENKKILKEN